MAMNVVRRLGLCPAGRRLHRSHRRGARSRLRRAGDRADAGRDPRGAPPGVRPGGLRLPRRPARQPPGVVRQEPGRGRVRAARPHRRAGHPQGPPGAGAGARRRRPVHGARARRLRPAERHDRRAGGDFEAVTTYGIGLARRQPFTVSTLSKPEPGRDRRPRSLPHRLAQGLVPRPGPVRRQHPAVLRPGTSAGAAGHAGDRGDGPHLRRSAPAGARRRPAAAAVRARPASPRAARHARASRGCSSSAGATAAGPP